MLSLHALVLHKKLERPQFIQALPQQALALCIRVVHSAIMQVGLFLLNLFQVGCGEDVVLC